jgi:uncharacterized membrane protein
MHWTNKVGHHFTEPPKAIPSKRHIFLLPKMPMSTPRSRQVQKKLSQQAGRVVRRYILLLFMILHLKIVLMLLNSLSEEAPI